MANANPLRVVIQGVDRLTAPLRRINQRLAGMRAPVQRLNGAFRAMAEESGLTRLGASVRNVGNRVGNVVARTRDLTARLGAMGAVAGGVFGVMVNGYTRTANETKQWADRLGMSAQALQELQYSAGKFNVENDAMRDGLKELTMRADEFVVTGKGPAAEAFQRLGLSRDELRKTGGDTEKLFALITSRMEGLENTAARQRISDELLGGQAGEQMVEWITAGSDAMAASRQEARRLGVAYKDGALKNAEAFTRTMGKLKGALDGARNALLGPLIPTLTKLGERLSAFVADNQERIRAFGQDLAERLPGALRDLGEAFTSIKEKFEAFLDFISPITDRFGLLKTAMVGIGLVVAGPLLAALASLTSALVTLGVTLLTTPVGWFLGAVALIGGAVYMIVKNWDNIAQFFTDKFAAVRAAFDQGLIQGVLSLLREFSPVGLVMDAVNAIVEWLTGFSLADAAGQLIDTITAGIRGKIGAVLGAFDSGILQGIYTLLREFNPVVLMAEAIDSIVEYVTGFSLSDAGTDLVDSLWDGIKSKFDALTGWFKDKVRGLTDMVPDWMKDAGGVVSSGVSSLSNTVAGVFGNDQTSRGADEAAPSSRAANAVQSLSGAQRNEVSLVARFENMPQGARVDTEKNTGVDTQLDLGWSMMGGM